MSEIRNRYTGAVICSGECSVKELVERNKESLYVANLRRADLSEANLSGSYLYGANLSGANLRGANLRWANLREANLYGANLYGANLYGANLYGADLRWADLRGAKYGEETLLKYLSIGTIGSRNDALRVFITQDNIYLNTGCWSGTPEELLERTGRDDYKEAVDYIVIVAERVRQEVQGERFI